jgi:hypothetical protein
MTKPITLPEPFVKWARHKTSRVPKKPLPSEGIMSPKHFSLYQNATDKQRKWVEEFLQTGDSDLAARIAYPTAKVASVYQLSLKGRKRFGLTKKDLEKFMNEHPTY